MLRLGTEYEGLMATAMGRKATTNDDVVMWEDRVHSLLLANNYQLMAARFMADDPQDDSLESMFRAAVLPNPLRHRLIWRLNQLEEIIQELPKP
jgi:hypothetical protein